MIWRFMQMQVCNFRAAEPISQYFLIFLMFAPSHAAWSHCFARWSNTSDQGVCMYEVMRCAVRGRDWFLLAACHASADTDCVMCVHQAWFTSQRQSCTFMDELKWRILRPPSDSNYSPCERNCCMLVVISPLVSSSHMLKVKEWPGDFVKYWHNDRKLRRRLTVW